MDESSTWHRRLAFVLARRKLRPTDLALLLCVTPAAVTKWLSGGDIRYTKLREMCRLLRVNWVWLRYGEEGLHSVNDERRGDTDRDAWLAAQTGVITDHEAAIPHTLGATIGVGVWMLDVVTGIYSTSAVTRHLLGVPEQVRLDALAMQNMMDSENARRQSAFYKRLSSGEARSSHYTFQVKHRPNVQMKARGFAVLGPNRKVRRVVGYVHREDNPVLKTDG